MVDMMVKPDEDAKDKDDQNISVAIEGYQKSQQQNLLVHSLHPNNARLISHTYNNPYPREKVKNNKKERMSMNNYYV